MSLREDCQPFTRLLGCLVQPLRKRPIPLLCTGTRGTGEGCRPSPVAELSGQVFCRSRSARASTGQAWQSWSSRLRSTTSCRRRLRPTGSSSGTSLGRWVPSIPAWPSSPTPTVFHQSLCGTRDGHGGHRGPRTWAAIWPAPRLSLNLLCVPPTPTPLVEAGRSYHQEPIPGPPGEQGLGAGRPSCLYNRGVGSIGGHRLTASLATPSPSHVSPSTEGSLVARPEPGQPVHAPAGLHAPAECPGPAAAGHPAAGLERPPGGPPGRAAGV